ncbi:MAG: hypothetical protein U1E27_06770 [Kiritimatiellia bacterium]|nr:hypothetical protein [Kiritimatiellia bacterium]
MPTHTQALSADIAELAAPTPAAFAEGLLRLAAEPDRGRRLATAARERVRLQHSPAAYRKTLTGLYEEIKASL